MTLNFPGITKFLENTAEDDREFLREEEIYKIPSTSCALANSSGGWIILGAEIYEDGEIEITGVKNSNIKINSLIPSGISFDVQILGGGFSKKIIIIFIENLEWNKKPFLFEGNFYRRVEGVNLISSKKSAAIVACDVFENSCDDEPAMNFFINPESVEDFYKTTIKMKPEYKNFSVDEFLSRSFIFSGNFLTFAGVLMFGNVIKIRAVLDYEDVHAELTENNIWDAYKNILPRLVNKLSLRCSQALQEIFINALLHADYKIDNSINISITSKPPKISIDNPGFLRGNARNKRLKKIFDFSGMSVNGRGLETIKKYMPSFKLKEDMLNFRVNALLDLEGQIEPAKSMPVIL